MSIYKSVYSKIKKSLIFILLFLSFSISIITFDFCNRGILNLSTDNESEKKGQTNDTIDLFYLRFKKKVKLQTVYNYGTTTVDFSDPSKVNMSKRMYGYEDRYYYGSAYYSYCLYNANNQGHLCTLVEYLNNGNISGWNENMGSYGDVHDIKFVDDYIFIASVDINKQINISIYNRKDINTRLRMVRSFVNVKNEEEVMSPNKVSIIGDKVYVSSSESHKGNASQVIIFSKSYLLDPNVKGTKLNNIGTIGEKGVFFDIQTNNSNNLILGKVTDLSNAYGYLFISSNIGKKGSTDAYKVDIYKDDKYIKTISECKDVLGNIYYLDNISSISELHDKYIAIVARSSISGNNVLIFDKDNIFKKEGDIVAKTVFSQSKNSNDPFVLSSATLDKGDIIINIDRERTIYIYSIGKEIITKH